MQCVKARPCPCEPGNFSTLARYPTGSLQPNLASGALYRPYLAGAQVLVLPKISQPSDDSGALTALMTFEAEVGGEHPEVNKWVMDRYRELVTNLNAWRRLVGSAA